VQCKNFLSLDLNFFKKHPASISQ